MKKLIFMAMAGLLLCGCCTEIKLVSGSYRALSQQVGTAEFVLDMSEAQAVEYGIENPFSNERKISHVIGTVDERMQLAGADYVREWPDVYRKMSLYFVERFNRAHGNKGISLSAGKGTTPYKVVFHVDHIDFGSTGANVAMSVVNSVVGDGIFYGGGVGGCIVDGTIELIDTTSGNVLGIIQVWPVNTEGSPSENARLYELMRYTGKWAGRRAKH